MLLVVMLPKQACWAYYKQKRKTMRSPFTVQNTENVHPHASIDGFYALEVRDLSVHYQGVEALATSSATFKTAALHAIAGPNGAGKSSFMRGVLALTEKTSGCVMVNGHTFSKPQHARDYHVAYVPQRANIMLSFPISVLDVVASGLHRSRAKIFLSAAEKREQKDKVWAMLDSFGLKDLAHRQIGQLSGGQQQRVFFARALVASPKLLMLDEPFNGIDMPTTTYLFERLKQEVYEHQTTILAIHHDLHSLDQFDTVTLVNGRIVVSGLPSQVLTPAWIERTYA